MLIEFDKPPRIYNHNCSKYELLSLGASDYYGTDLGELFDYLTAKIGLSINTLKGFVKKKTPLKRTEFLSLYSENKEYYYIAYSV